MSKPEQLELFDANYIVLIRDFSGRKEILCNTVREAWNAIGSREFGGLYEVHSPVGLDVSEFIPF